jgi:hypothetical protein
MNGAPSPRSRHGLALTKVRTLLQQVEYYGEDEKPWRDPVVRRALREAHDAVLRMLGDDVTGEAEDAGAARRPPCKTSRGPVVRRLLLP